MAYFDCFFLGVKSTATDTRNHRCTLLSTATHCHTLPLLPQREWQWQWQWAPSGAHFVANAPIWTRISVGFVCFFQGFSTFLQVFLLFLQVFLFFLQVFPFFFQVLSFFYKFFLFFFFFLQFFFSPMNFFFFFNFSKKKILNF
jgi:hypothetical protein